MLSSTSTQLSRLVGVLAVVPIGMFAAADFFDLSPLVLYPVGLLLVVGVGIASWWYRRKRAEALRAWATAIGWTYVGTDHSLASRWQGTPFGRGRNRRVSEVIVGPFGPYRAVSFAYRYTTGSGKNRQTHEHHVVSLSMPAWLPSVQLTPQGIGARMVTALGGQDLEFESADFNRRWRVEARDPRFAHDVLHPRTLERLVRPDAAGLNLRLAGSDVLSWSTGLPDVETLAARLGVMRALIDGIPRHVWLDHGFDPAQVPAGPQRR